MIVILILTSTDESGHVWSLHQSEPRVGPGEEGLTNQRPDWWGLKQYRDCNLPCLSYNELRAKTSFVSDYLSKQTPWPVYPAGDYNETFIPQQSLSLSLRVRARKKGISEYETEPTGEIICLLTSLSHHHNQDKNRMIIIDQRQELSGDCRCWPVSLYSSHQVIRIKWRQLR